VKEIRRREQQLASLREALAQLDAALEAAAKAHAVSAALAERPLTAQAAEATREVRSGMHAVATPSVPPPQPSVQAAPAPPPMPVAPVIESAPAAPPSIAPVVNATPRPTNSGPYANMKVWRAVQEMLTEHRKSMTLEEIVRHLQEGGASLGSSTIRTVSTAIGYMNDKIFHVSKSGGETYVNLLRPAE